MGITEDIEKMIFHQTPDSLTIESDHEELITNCLRCSNAENSANLFKFIFEVHQKKEALYELIKDLWLYEDKFTEIVPEHRDHLRHSANVYALGLGIYNVSPFFRDSLRLNRHKNKDQHAQKTSFLYRWSLAASCHDVAYPLQLSVESFNEYSRRSLKTVEENESFITIDSRIVERMNLLSILRPDITINIEKQDTALGLISYALSDYQQNRSRMKKDTLLSYIQRKLADDLSKGIVDHGVFAALLLLNRIHDLYEVKVEWPIDDFYNEVVDSCTAIFLHNFYKYSDLKKYIGDGKYLYDYPSPIGYLLFVCDTICEWSRKNKDESDLFHVISKDNQIVFRIHEKFKDKMESETALFDPRAPIEIEWFD